jgi:hypothetical protein
MWREASVDLSSLNPSSRRSSSLHMKRSMTRSIFCRLACLVVFLMLGMVLGVAPATFAGAAGESSAEGVSFGFGVSPLRDSLGLATVPGAVGGEGVRPLEADPRGGVLSFDLKLAWPGAVSTSVVEPYLAVGPALIVVEPDYAGRLLGTRVDSSLRPGARAGGGVNFRLGKNTTLFGAYEVTTAGQGRLTSPGGKAPADTEVSGYDLTYGLRFRY